VAKVVIQVVIPAVPRHASAVVVLATRYCPFQLSAGTRTRHGGAAGPAEVCKGLLALHEEFVVLVLQGLGTRALILEQDLERALLGALLLHLRLQRRHLLPQPLCHALGVGQRLGSHVEFTPKHQHLALGIAGASLGAFGAGGERGSVRGELEIL
jgi:integral membrane sensor domain MASE1